MVGPALRVGLAGARWHVFYGGDVSAGWLDILPAGLDWMKLACFVHSAPARFLRRRC